MKMGKVLMECEDKRRIIVPEGITHIEGYFGDYEQLEELFLPDSLIKIGEGVFADCINLKKIHFGDGIEEIGDDAFSGCDSLEEVMLPGSINWIGQNAFASCNSLRYVYVFDGVDARGDDYIMNIADRAFADCKKLKAVEIKKRVEDWGDKVFERSGLEEFVFPPMVERVDERDPLHTNVYVGERMFQNCHQLKEVVLPPNLERIDEHAFRGCKMLNRVVRQDGTWEEIELEKMMKYNNSRKEKKDD